MQKNYVQSARMQCDLQTVCFAYTYLLLPFTVLCSLWLRPFFNSK